MIIVKDESDRRECEAVVPAHKGWLVTAGGALALANLLYVTVNDRVFRPSAAT